MSYAHCDKHNQEATNGCPACGAEALREKCLEGGRRALATFARLTGEPCPEEYEEAMTSCCALVFLDGLCSFEGERDRQAVVRVRLELEATLSYWAKPGGALAATAQS
jgi:hypothetical protein